MLRPGPQTLTSRLGIRMLVTHHLLLQETPQPGWIGIVNLGMGLREVVQRWVNFVVELTENKYGHCPAIKATPALNNQIFSTF